MSFFIVKHNNKLIAASDEDAEYLCKCKEGDIFEAKRKGRRSYDFHKKYFALLNFAFDHWEPGEIGGKYKDLKPQKNFDRFREDITILSGFYSPTIRVDGSVRIEAKSISFSRMSEDEFEQLYSKTIDVILERVLKNYCRDDIEDVMANLVGFM